MRVWGLALLLLVAFQGAQAATVLHEAQAPAGRKVLAACEELRKNDVAVHGCALKNSEGVWSVVLDYPDEDCAAHATFVDGASTLSGFGKLRVVTGAGYSDLDQAYGAGFVEGYLTAPRIYDHHYNLKRYFIEVLNETVNREAAIDWLEQQDAWVTERLASADPEDPYWRVLGLVQAQFAGLVDGYQRAAREEAAENKARRSGGARRLLEGGTEQLADDVRAGWLDRRELMFLNSNGDVYDIMDAIEAGFGPDGTGNGNGDGQPSGAQSRRRWPRTADIDEDPERMALKLGLQGKCSAIIKVTGDLGELLLGHSTHDSFTAMTRIYKHYDFAAMQEPAAAAQQVSFSSYPGELFSDDDFYLLSSGLYVTETTNHIYNDEVFRAMSPECVLSWQRLRLANWMAASGTQWINFFTKLNSGTYNNQYMIVDVNRFVPHQELQPGLLWVLEQLPGMIKAADMTDELVRGYWPSYNVAYFPEIYEAAGYPNMIDRLVEEGAKKHAFSIRLLKYQIAPRAAIFRRDQGAVSDLEGLKRLMRYNDFKSDPYAEGNPVGAVCGRGDLAKGDAAMAKGCYDSKVTTASMLKRMEADVVAGPTTQGQPPFSWSDPRWSDLPHRGMPDTWDYSYERMTAKELPTAAECAAAAANRQAAAAQSLLLVREGDLLEADGVATA
ncbi:hypothetical protein HYH03_002184 [Edaphochlamys debaryana]|uniref:Phospholipase B-like n=1 Tax=Edaphochlamys debaryana TaxID=47281 RepID=A0A835YFE2_9CHLO|nr:hypothetical protein HYH03_002184 [Edaphochlamys debaryana]|eukprot:KAG2499896.1 hypothetical protein HYH03_002184 [Edaphochlamys debaryana]